MTAETQRRKARELALKAIYAQAVSDQETSDVSDSYLFSDLTRILVFYYKFDVFPNKFDVFFK